MNFDYHQPGYPNLYIPYGFLSSSISSEISSRSLELLTLCAPVINYFRDPGNSALAGMWHLQLYLPMGVSQGISPVYKGKHYGERFKMHHLWMTLKLKCHIFQANCQL